LSYLSTNRRVYILRTLVFIYCFFLCSECINAQGTLGLDSSKKGHLYSFTLSPGGGFSTNGSKFYDQYLQKLAKGTPMEAMELTSIPLDPNGYFEVIVISASLEWRYKFKRGRVLNQWEWSTGLGVMHMEGGDVNRAVMSNPNYPAGIPKDTLRVGGMPLLVNALSWNNRISLHSGSLLKMFGLFTGLEWNICYGRYGKKEDPAHVDQTELPYTNSAFHQLSAPVGLKCNVSCELNLEFVYKPGFLVGSGDVFKTGNYTPTQFFSIGLRYKLQNSPPVDKYKRTDMFF
jgi:hypothetical protein